MQERWRDIEDHPGYQVSDHGRVIGVRGRILAQQLMPSGYMSVKLGAAAGRKFTHRLVAKAFVKGDHTLTVDHEDGVKSNNYWRNLSWKTKSQQTRHAYEVLGRSCRWAEQPVSIHGWFFPSMVIAGALLEIPPASLRNALRLNRRCRGMKVTRWPTTQN